MTVVGYIRNSAKRVLSFIHRTSGRRLERRWNIDPFGTEPRASRDEYLALHKAATGSTHPDVAAVETEAGACIDRAWIEELALHTQVTIKRSDLVFEHGKLLYALLRKYITASGASSPCVLETGTARGFSAVCMAKALNDAGTGGFVVTVDVLPHGREMYWNVLDDLDGRKSRQELLAPWEMETSRIVFLQGECGATLEHLGLGRIHFAFLDAQHTRDAVLAEFEFVSSRQRAGDIVFFDDVTEGVFPGVVAAVNEIERDGRYVVRRLRVSDQRSYAWAARL